MVRPTKDPIPPETLDLPALMQELAQARTSLDYIDRLTDRLNLSYKLLHPNTEREIPGLRLLRHTTDYLTRRGLQALYPPLEERVITDRLEALKTGGHGRGYVRLLQQMPPRYWQVLLMKTNDPQGWQQQPDRPAWAARLKPIATKGEYLRAVRLALSLGVDDIEFSTLRAHGDHLVRLETMLISEPAILARDYESLCKVYGEQTPLFQPAVFAELTQQAPSHESRSRNELRAGWQRG